VKAGENETAGVLSTDEALAVIDQIRDVGTPIIVLSGGEPLLRDDLCEIAWYGTEQGLRMVMGTSGYFLARSMAARLRDAGIRSVAVSIDSADPAVHDSGIFGSDRFLHSGMILLTRSSPGSGKKITISVGNAGHADILTSAAAGVGSGHLLLQGIFHPKIPSLLSTIQRERMGA
jgi:hypothetical protein